MPPPGAVDAHCHVFGPGDVFPYAPERKYTPCDAPKEKLWALRDFLGFERNVIVQATCHGADNRALVDALRRVERPGARRRDREEQMSPTSELRELRCSGRARRALQLRQAAGGCHAARGAASRSRERIEPLGWHVVIYFEAQDLPELYDFFASLPTIVVVDHMGRPDVTQAGRRRRSSSCS